MKNLVLLFGFLMTSTLGFGQWEQVGNTIVEQDIDNAIGYSLATNDTGEIVALLRFVNNPLIEVSILMFENGSWTFLGNTVTIYNGNNTNANITMNGDGTRFAVGVGPSSELGFVKTFELQNNSWIQLGQTILGDTAGDGFGGSVAINSEGNWLISGAGRLDGGYIKVFEFENGDWVQKGETIEENASSSQLGSSVAMNAAGDVIAASAPSSDEGFTNAGKIQIFEFETDNWVPKGSAIIGAKAQDRIGLANKPGNSTVKLNDIGDIVAYGTWAHLDENDEQAGLVEVYEFVNNIWQLKGNRFEGDANNNYLGGSIDLNTDGNIISMTDFGAIGVAKVLTFNFEDGDWEQIGETIIDPDNNDSNFFGFSVAMNEDGNVLVIGDPNDGGGEQSKIWIFREGQVLGLLETITSQFKLYPNPNNGIFDISFTENQERITIDIVDLLGRQVVTIDYFNTNTIAVDENLKAGIYLVEISAKGISETVRIIVE